MKTLLKFSLLLAGVGLTLTGCQTINPANIKTTASPQTIATAQKDLANIKHVKVLDNGVIYFDESVLGTRYMWDPATSQTASYRVACKQLRDFVKAGMVVRVKLEGLGGTTLDYNEQTCESQAPTNA
ncbi:hypothetical protein M9194_01945 [Vibrio sp. S4M6]|uniref:hypothetical protein n=1 Tax=Vibrio sinus TaxID=2946865 RepID=UPI00202A4959|nr:hypothetical protein [Vibrio sinus]MCL9780192.1 hypothetical protein [Vibrio sinus]